MIGLTLFDCQTKSSPPISPAETAAGNTLFQRQFPNSAIDNRGPARHILNHAEKA
jgi:hypothetical protein